MLFIPYIILLISIDNTRSEKSFYRLRGKQIATKEYRISQYTNCIGSLIATETSITSEGCLGACFLNPKCKTFNTVEKSDATHECQLFSNDHICGLVLKPDSNSSVYFSSKSCDRMPRAFRIKYNSGYLVMRSDRIVVLPSFNAATLFELNGANNLVLPDSQKCLKWKKKSSKNVKFEPIIEKKKACLEFYDSGDELVNKEYDECFETKIENNGGFVNPIPLLVIREKDVSEQTCPVRLKYLLC